MIFNDLTLQQQLLPFLILALLVIFILLPLLSIAKSIDKKRKQLKEELQLLREQNELLKQIANNKGE